MREKAAWHWLGNGLLCQSETVKRQTINNEQEARKMTKLGYNECFNCNDYTECDGCISMREFNITTLIQQKVPPEKTITYAVSKPIIGFETLRIRKRLSKIIRKISDGHIWTIETRAGCDGLHISLLISGDREITKDDIPENLITASGLWVSQIKNNSLKAATKHIFKHQLVAKVTRDTGLTYGGVGTMRTSKIYVWQ